MKIDFLRVDVMDDLTQLEIDNLRHEIEGLVGVFAVQQVAAQQSFAAGVAKCPPGKHNFENGLHCSVCGEAQF